MKARVLIQIDSDPDPSVFDAVVAIDSDVDHLLSYGGVTSERVVGLVHGAIFTRGPDDLCHTAIFVGGSDVAAGERLVERIRASFFGDFRVSVFLDANGANTTAAAGVLAARRHMTLSGARALVLAGTGPVGQRAARLLAREQSEVVVASRRLDRAAETCDRIRQSVGPTCHLEPIALDDVGGRLSSIDLVIAAGAAGIELLARSTWRNTKSLRTLIDLNAVPPLGIEGVDVTDKGITRDGVVCYGAIGVGGTKMKIHRAAIRQLFERNDQILDAEEVFAVGQLLES